MAFLIIPSLTWKKMFFNIFLTSYSQVHQAQKMEMKQVQPTPQIQQVQPIPDTSIQSEKIKNSLFFSLPSFGF
jgi:hypothetical protein